MVVGVRPLCQMPGVRRCWNGGVRADAAVVLAGGRSSRFGSDKTKAEVRGATLLEHVVHVAEQVADRVLVVGPWAPDGVDRVREDGDHPGPLAALECGLSHLRPSSPGRGGLGDDAAVLVLAADHPDLRVGLLQLLVTSLRGDDDAVLPTSAGRLQPLVACYRCGVHPAVDQLLAEGGSSLHALLDRLRLRTLEPSEWRLVDPDGLSFADVDEPGDLDPA